MKTKKEYKQILNSLSERCLKNLHATITIHLKIDRPENQLTDKKDNRRYHLRKVLFHAAMIRDFGNFNGNLHIIAVECRVAHEQIDKVLGKDKQFSSTVDLSPFVHPTPFLLGYPQSIGGLGIDSDIKLHRERITILSSFCVGYATSLSSVYVDSLLYGIEEILSEFTCIKNDLPSREELKVFF